jgi:tetrahydromethanopterin S-methyltransferase subunit A
MAKDEEYYPWGGEFTVCNSEGAVAVVLLTVTYTPPSSVALYGSLKTENIGVEKIVANVISNPHIRFLVVCGDDIRGHRAGASLLALHKNGIDENHRIIDAPGAIPYIENLDASALTRFQQQINMIDLLGVTDDQAITDHILTCTKKKSPSFGEPFIAIRMQPEIEHSLEDKRALHARIMIDYQGHVTKRGE